MGWWELQKEGNKPVTRMAELEISLLLLVQCCPSAKN